MQHLVVLDVVQQRRRHALDWEDMKMAVPGRAPRSMSALAKTSIGSASSAMWSRISARPFDQVVRRVKIAPSAAAPSRHRGP